MQWHDPEICVAAVAPPSQTLWPSPPTEEKTLPALETLPFFSLQHLYFWLFTGEEQEESRYRIKSASIQTWVQSWVDSLPGARSPRG